MPCLWGPQTYHMTDKAMRSCRTSGQGTVTFMIFSSTAVTSM